MPTVSRFLIIIATLAAIVYAAMFALANSVTPRQGEISVGVPLDSVRPEPVAPAADLDGDGAPVSDEPLPQGTNQQ